MLRLAGLLRSLAIYYGHPLRHARLKRLYAGFVRPGDLVFDAGAHAGNHTRAFLALGARVVAIEPQPLFAWFLGQILGRHPRVTLLQTALGARKGRSEMQISRRTPTVSTLDPGWQRQMDQSAGFAGVRWDERIDVAVDTLDGVIAALGRPAFIKIDVEGSEADVLRGLSEPVPALCFEAIPAAAESARACLDRLVDLGFTRFNWTEGEKAVLQPAWIEADAARQMLAVLPAESRERNIFARFHGN